MTVLLAAALLGGGCSGEIFGFSCTTELRPNLYVEVRDALTGAPAALGATGSAEHQSGSSTELSPAFDSLRLHGNWRREQAGDYAIQVRKPGRRPVFVRTTVDDGGCHVETRTVRVSLEPEPVSEPVAATRFETGAHVSGWSASAGVQVFGDTLVMVGRAYAPCTELALVAYRTGNELHVQLEPAPWPASGCGESPRLQQFEARYQLPFGTTVLYVTNAFGEPTVLFNGYVGPT